MNAAAPSARTTVRRLPDRGVYARIGQRLCLHGSPASRMLRALVAGAPIPLPTCGRGSPFPPMRSATNDRDEENV